MLVVYDPNASKQLVNLSINGDLLDRSKELSINLSAALENALAEAVSQHQRKLRLEQNPNFLAVATNLFGDELRARRWLTAQNGALGGQCPIDAEVDEVLDLIRRLEHGFCA